MAATPTEREIADEINALVEGTTIATVFAATSRRNANLVALRDRGADGTWREFTYAQFADQVARAAAGLAALGVGHGDRVVLMMRNRPEFHILDLAVLFCGATPVSIYNSSSAEQVAYLAGHCHAKVGIVEDDGYLDRFLERRSDLPELATLAIIHRSDATPADVLNYADLVAHDPVDLDQAAAACSPDDLATIIYTSGTTGAPKGVMLTHHNIVWTVESLKRAIGIDDQHWRVVSYLPMAHIAERMVSHYQMITMGYEVSTCPETGQLASYLADVKPQLLFGVPRVYEKLSSGVMGALAADPEKHRQFSEALDAAQPIAIRRAWGEATDDDNATWDFLDAVAFQPVRALLGLDELEIAVTGAAPMSAELLSWFRSVGVPLTEIYGMSESSGPMNWAPYRVKPGSVGPSIPGQELKLGDDGEVLVRGGHVFIGYLSEPEKTADALDDDGWLHSGDIGEIDSDGYLRIVDRKKELLVTAGGKNVSPANLEAALKDIPLIGQAIAVGDKRPFIAALVTLDADVAPVWAAERGLPTDLAALVNEPELVAAVDAEIARVMARFNNAERVKKVTILADEWLPDSALLTPTFKLKRRGIHDHYQSQIDAMYT